MKLSKRLKIKTGLDEVSPAVAQKLVEALYVNDAIVPIGTSIQVTAAILIYLRTGAWWILVWGGLAVLVTTGRLALVRAYWRSTPAQHTPQTRNDWVYRFLIGTWISGALWGSVSIILLLDTDMFAPFILIVCTAGFVGGANVRLSPVPAIANGHSLLYLVPFAVAALATREPLYLSLDLFVLINLFAGRALVANVHRQILRALNASEQNAKLAADLADINRNLEEMVTTDALTDLVNRRGFDVRLLQECAGARRSDLPLSLLLIDVDHFKRFNDHYGHQTGDDCLRRVAAVIGNAVRRPLDIAARYGGEEFAVILPGTDEAGTRAVAEQVRAAVAASLIPHAVSEFGRVTVSIGAATIFSAEAPSPARLVRFADAALYAAKRAGRNCLSAYLPASVDAERSDMMLEGILPTRPAPP